MKNLEGFVFIVNEQERYYLFGKGNETQSYLNIESNGLASFSELDDAVRSAHEFDIERDFNGNPLIADYKLSMAETQEELGRFEEESDLVIVMDWKSKDAKLIGDYVEGRMHVTADRIGCPLCYNGIMPFNSKGGRSAFDRVNRAASEVARQGHIPVVIAQFYLRIREDSYGLLSAYSREH